MLGFGTNVVKLRQQTAPLPNNDRVARALCFGVASPERSSVTVRPDGTGENRAVASKQNF
jgi:hypothetical protein